MGGQLGIIDFTPKYQSTATLFVATQTGTTTAEAYQNDMFSQQRAVSYAALATSEQVAARAVDQLKAPISPDDLRAKISAKVRDKTVMLDVSVTDSSPEQAQIYADAVSNQLVAVVSQLETSRRGGTPSAAAVVVDNADYPTADLDLKLWMRLALGAVGGLIVGMLAALMTGVLDKRLRARESIEYADRFIGLWAHCQKTPSARMPASSISRVTAFTPNAFGNCEPICDSPSRPTVPARRAASR